MMNNKGKLMVAVAIIVVAVGASITLSKTNLLQGRFERGDPDRRGGGDERGRRDERSDGRGGGAPEAASKEVTPSGEKNEKRWAVSNEPYFADDLTSKYDFSIYTAELGPSSTPGYYRVTSNFKHTIPAAAAKKNIDWGAGIHGQEVPTLALKEVAYTVKSYAFDILNTKLCAKPIRFATVKTMLDPYNKITETDETNNSFFTSMICPNNPVITRCDMAIEVVKALGPNWDPSKDPGSPFPKAGAQVPAFLDVPWNSECGKAANKLKAAGFLDNAPNFFPDAEVSRAEAAKILITAFGMDKVAPNYNDSKFYNDISGADWFFSYVENLATYANSKGKLGLVEYIPGSYFSGQWATVPWFKDMLSLFE